MNRRYNIYFLAILFLSFVFAEASGQTRNAERSVTIESSVTDASGAPIAGALISGDEGAVEVLSDANGEFTITVTENSDLRIDAKGYQRQVVTVYPSVEIASVRLEPSRYSPEESSLVNIPFGQVMRKDLVGAVTVIDPKGMAYFDNTQTVADAINGRVPGMLGSTNLRGMGSALVIVDGIPRDASSINLVEVDQITVMKDANSAILYGTQASNGVIMVTTKRGEPLKRKIEFSVEQGVSDPVTLPKYLNSAQSMRLYNEALTNDGLDPEFDEAEIALFEGGTNPYLYPDVNYYSGDFLNNTRPFSRVIGEFSGGSEVAQYFASVGWTHSGSLYKFVEGNNGSADRFNVRARVDFDASEYIKSSIGAVVIYDGQNNPHGDFWGNAATQQPWLYSPLIPVSMIDETAIGEGIDLSKTKRINGDYILGGTPQYTSNVYGNMMFAGYTQNVRRTIQFNNSVEVDLKNVTEGLKFKTYLSFDIYNTFNQWVLNDYAVYNPKWTEDNGTDRVTDLTAIGVDLFTGNLELGDASFTRRTGAYGMFDYNRSFGDHSFSGSLLGYFDKVNTQGVIINTRHSHLGLRLAYAYQDKYLVDFSSAYVNGFKLKPGNKGGFSPSLGLAWVAKNQDYAESGALNYLKVRLSGGIVNTEFDGTNYRLYENALVQGPTFTWWDGSRGNRETLINRSPNPGLTFEKVKNLNLGVEAYTFDRSLYLEANVFTSRHSGQVVQRMMYPALLSNFVPYENYNATGYTGAELGAIWTKSFGELSLDLGVNVLYATSKVVQRDELFLDEYQYREGRAADAMFALEADGFFRDQADIDNSPFQAFGQVRPGDIKYKDQNGDNVIDQGDEIQIGNSQPRFSYGLNATLRYKNFSLFAIGTGQTGYDRYLNGAYFWVQGNDRYSEEVLGRWTPATASTATYPRLTSGNSSNNFRNSTFWMYNTSLFTLGRVQLSYDLPRSLTSRWAFRNVGVYVRGMNLMTVGTNAEKQQIRIGSEPLYRSYAIGARLSF